MSRKKRKPPKLDEETKMIFDVLEEIKNNKGEAEVETIPHYTKPKQFTNHCVNSTDFILNRIKALQKTGNFLHEGEPLAGVHDDYLFSLLEDSTQLSMAVRTAILGEKGPWYASRREALCKHIKNVVIGHPEGTILRVTIPPLIGRRFKGTYDIYWAVKVMLEEYYSKNERPILYGEKLLLIYKKYAPNLSVCFTCDNDNWEAKRVTNAISEAFLYSDNAEHFSMMYTAVNSRYDFVEATVIRIQDMPKFADYILDPEAAQPL